MIFKIIKLAFLVITGIFITVLIFDIILMGAVSLKFSRFSKSDEYLITKENQIDYQDGVECAGFSVAYILRHFGIEAYGNDIYDEIPNKVNNGTVYPKHVKKILQKYGLNTKYVVGNLNALKNELSKGYPVIVFIRMQEKNPDLHFVPVVGYDKEHIYIAESVPYLQNCKTKYYNRKIENKDFLKLWNTSMLKMPIHTNTFFAIK